MQPFFRSMKLLRLYTRFMSLCTDLPPKGRDLYRLWAAYPCLSWFAVAMRALTWVVFVPRASFMPTQSSGSSPSPMRQRAGNIVHARRVLFPGNYLPSHGYRFVVTTCSRCQEIQCYRSLYCSLFQPVWYFNILVLTFQKKGLYSNQKLTSQTKTSLCFWPSDCRNRPKVTCQERWSVMNQEPRYHYALW